MKKIKLGSFAFALMAIFAINVNAEEVSTKTNLTTCLGTTGNTCKLTTNIVVDSQIIIEDDKNVILDLNGHSITATDGMVLNSGIIAIKHGGKLTINDSVGGGAISTGNTEVYAAIAMTVNKFDIDNSKTAELILNGGTLAGYYYGITGNGNDGRDNTTVTINGGTVKTLSSEGTGIYNPQIGTITVNDGTVIGTTGIEMRSGNLYVKGGKIKGTGSPASVESNGNGTTTEGAGIAVVQHQTRHSINVEISDGIIEGFNALVEKNIEEKNNPTIEEYLEKVKISVTGGTFNAINSGALAVYSENLTSFIKGGSFNKELEEDYVANTYVVNFENSRYVVSENNILGATIDEGKVTFKGISAFNRGYTLIVTKESKENQEKINEEIKKNYQKDNNIKDVSLVGLYEISLSDGENIVEVKNGEYEISIPITEEMRNFNNYKVVYVVDGEIKEYIDAKLIDGKIVFKTSHLSTYGIIGYNDVVVSNPKTSDINIMLVLFLLLIGGAGVICSTSKKAYKRF